MVHVIGNKSKPPSPKFEHSPGPRPGVAFGPSPAPQMRDQDYFVMLLSGGKIVVS